MEEYYNHSFSERWNERVQREKDKSAKNNPDWPSIFCTFGVGCLKLADCDPDCDYSCNCKKADDHLADILAEDFHFQHLDNPEFASQSGNHTYDHLLQDLSPGAFDKRHQHNLKMLHKLEWRCKPTNLSSDHLRLRRVLFVDNLVTESKGFELGCHLYPLNSIGYGGVVNNFLETLEWQEDVVSAPDKFISRLEAFPTQVEQFIELLRHGLTKKRVASKDMLRLFSQQTLAASSDATPIENLLESVTDSNLRARGGAGIEAYAEACVKLERFVRVEYEPHARSVGGCTGMETRELGSEIYALSLRFHTTTTMTPEEVHQVGLSEVERIRERYRDEVLVPLGRMTKKEVTSSPDDLFVERFAQFVEECRNDPSNYYEREEDLLSGYQDKCDEIRRTLPDYFQTFPKSELEIVRKDAPTAPAA